MFMKPLKVDLFRLSRHLKKDFFNAAQVIHFTKLQTENDLSS
jgi:hypothetical protein